MSSGRIIVKGSGISKSILLDTTEATVIEFRDDDGNLLCFIPKLFPSNPNSLWGFCASTDKDFDIMCEKFGVDK